MIDDEKPAEPARPRVVVTVTGSRAVDGVAPGKRLPCPPLERLLYLMRAGHVSCAVDGKQISTPHVVAKMEGA